LEESVKSGDSSTSSWIVFCTNSSKDAICVCTSDYPQQSAHTHITHKEVCYVLVKVGVDDTPAVLLADDALVLVLHANRSGPPLVRHRRVSAQWSRSVKTTTEKERGKEEEVE
jgi:hypothetical protein